MADGTVKITAELDTDKLQSSMDGLGGKFKEFGSVLVSGLKEAGSALLNLTVDAVKATGELEQNIGGTEAVFKDMAETIQGKAVTAYKDMGVSANDYMSTANKMGSLMKGSGIDIATATDLTSAAMQRAADISSVMGISATDAFEAVTGAAKGNRQFVLRRSNAPFVCG